MSSIGVPRRLPHLPLMQDGRIPLSFAAGPGEGPPAAWLGAGQPDGAVAAVTPGGARHPIGCLCCQGRSAAAEALDRLYQGRVRGRLPWFDRVVAAPEHEAALRQALREDVMAAVRFRLSD